MKDSAKGLMKPYMGSWMLESKLGFDWFEKGKESMSDKRRRYMDSEMCEVSDDELAPYPLWTCSG